MNLDPIATALLAQLSPSGELLAIADAHNAALDEVLDEAERTEAAIARHVADETLVARLEDDFARATPAIADGVTALEAFAIPALSALAGPAAPFVSIGLRIACSVGLALLKGWAARRVGPPAPSSLPPTSSRSGP